MTHASSFAQRDPADKTEETNRLEPAVQLVIRNTFIDAVLVEDEEEDLFEPLERTCSTRSDPGCYCRENAGGLVLVNRPKILDEMLARKHDGMVDQDDNKCPVDQKCGLDAGRAENEACEIEARTPLKPTANPYRPWPGCDRDSRDATGTRDVSYVPVVLPAYNYKYENGIPTSNDGIMYCAPETTCAPQRFNQHIIVLPDSADERQCVRILPRYEEPSVKNGPRVGMLHTFHEEAETMGRVSDDYRSFTKAHYEGRLSVVSEATVHTGGRQRYLVQFTSGELSRADGVGFVFSPKLPCCKNIQKIVSIFVNQQGRICMRLLSEVVRASVYVEPIALGDWIELVVDLDTRVATFKTWRSTCNEKGWTSFGRPTSCVEVDFGSMLQEARQASSLEKRGGQKPLSKIVLNTGHFACVVKNTGVTVSLGS